MTVHTVMQLQVGDVLGMIANQITSQYNQKVSKVEPVYKTVECNGSFDKVLTHFEAHFEQELKTGD